MQQPNNLKNINSLKQKYNLIPIVKQTFADLDTPVSAYLKLSKQPYSYLFESVQGGEKWGRFSIIGLKSNKIIKIFGNKIKIYFDEKLQQEITTNDPLNWLEKYKREFKVAPLEETKTINQDLDNFDLFTGGLVGFFAYDSIRLMEEKLSKIKKNEISQTPDILLMVSQQVLVFDNLFGKIYLVVLTNPNEQDFLNKSHQKIDEILKKLEKPIARANTQKIKPPKKIEYFFKEQDYKNSVNKIKDYINSGDVMQVVLSQKMMMDFDQKPINLYRALRSLNPSPYMFFLDLADMQIVGSSPEILVRQEKDIITVRPIAGTRKRGQNEQQDNELIKELLSDPKELAEHLMLIDLGRNDVGRVSEIGSVKVTEKMQVEKYSHVMHIVSNVTGKLDSDKLQTEVLKATFPAGTVSGAPKIRAMEIINELEPQNRGVYGGAIGYLGWHNNFDTAIAIRTAVIKNNKVYIQAGAGIVYDSNPDAEWQETINKAQALIKAVNITYEI